MFTSVLRVRPALCAAVLFVVGCALTAPPAVALQPQRCPGALNLPTSEQALADAADAVVCLVNAERTSRGLTPLRRDRRLGDAAVRHSQDMARRDYFAHVTPAGRTPSDRVRDAGYDLPPEEDWKVGESLGWGTGGKATPSWVVGQWLQSPLHRRIVLSPDYVELGVGVAPGAPKPTTLPGATYTMDLGVIR
jgi:uncharacterized protein YkwD